MEPDTNAVPTVGTLHFLDTFPIEPIDGNPSTHVEFIFTKVDKTRF